MEPDLLQRPLSALPVLFGAGLVTSLTPCVYPMIPITAGILGGAGAVGRSRRTTLIYTLLYAVGLATVGAGVAVIALTLLASPVLEACRGAAEALLAA